MLTFSIILLILPIAVSLLFSIQFFLHNNNSTSKYLLLYLINFILYSLSVFFIIGDADNIVYTILPLIPLVTTLKAPLLFFYIKNILEPQGKSRAVKNIGQHLIFTCATVAIVCILFYGILDNQQATSFIKDDFNTGIFRFDSYKTNPIIAHYLYLGICISTCLISFFYAGLIYGQTNLRPTKSEKKDEFQVKKYIYRIGFPLLLTPINILIINLIKKNTITDSTLLMLILSVPEACILFHTCYYTLFHLKETETPLTVTENKEGAIEETQINSLSYQLNKLIIEEKPYLNPNLSLSYLATRLNTNNANLSKLFKEELNTNFRRYINRLRAEEAIQLAEKEKGTPKPNLTIISEEAGFNSYDTFSRTFAELYGTKPSIYFASPRAKKETQAIS